MPAGSLDMQKAILQPFIQGMRITGNPGEDAPRFLRSHNRPEIAGHCRNVALEAGRLAARFGEDEEKAETAGWLHDISAVFPSTQNIQIARVLGIEILTEEEACPMILHQKISAVMAREIFCVQDPAIFSAIGCHTTLKAEASTLDKVLFIADKIQWDQRGESPWSKSLLEALAESLDKAVWVYLDHLWQQRESLPVVHPWMVSAYLYSGKISR